MRYAYLVRLCARPAIPIRRMRGGWLRLAGRAPEQVAALQFGCADRGSAHPTRFARAAVDVGPRPAAAVGRRTEVVFRPDRDDLAAPHPDLHQLDQIGP